MEQTGENCRAMEKHIYWTDFAPNRHRFFKLMMGDFRNELRIPTKFVNHFKEKLLGAVRLVGPSGNVWYVKIKETDDDDVVFQIGWKKFVQDHSLAERDFLVFQYTGLSSFNASIFDQTGCEREGAFFIKKHILCSTNACFLENEEVEILQTTDVEEVKGKKEKLKGKDGATGTRKTNMRSMTAMLTGTSFKANNSNPEASGARKEELPSKRSKSSRHQLKQAK